MFSKALMFVIAMVTRHDATLQRANATSFDPIRSAQLVTQWGPANHVTCYALLGRCMIHGDMDIYCYKPAFYVAFHAIDFDALPVVVAHPTAPHYDDVIMGTIASQITSLRSRSVYSTVYSGADQSKHQSSASLAFVWGIHRSRWIPRTNGQLRGKCFHLMTSSWYVAMRIRDNIVTTPE